MLSGCSRPMRARMVGATSPSTPSVFFRLQDSGALAMTKGTLLRVCEVLGVPSSVSISSAFLVHCQCMFRGRWENNGLPVISGNEENVSALLALVIDLLDSLVGL
jgi:hypothetical protein